MLDQPNHAVPVISPSRDPRAPGATFALGTIAWIDFESRGPVPITAGTDRYSRSAEAILLAWAIGDGPIHVEAVASFKSGGLRWADMPKELRDFYERAKIGAGIFCAHNAGFDRAIWNFATYDFPPLYSDMMIDTAVQATASGLPRQLAFAARFAGAKILKDKRGTELIKLFTLPASVETPQSAPVAWQEFIAYARDDIGSMRELFKRTRQLPWAEWEEYWASEQINDYGICVDVEMVTAAAAMAARNHAQSARELADLTDGVVTSVNQVKVIGEWLRGLLPSDGREILVKRLEERDENGIVTKPAKWQLTRDRVVRLIAYLESLETLTNAEAAALRVLQIRRYDGSKTPAKFGRMRDSHVGGVIRGQYVFGGASQTGRFCVDADTLIDTPLGPRRIVDLEVGHLVVGGSGLFRKVVAQVYKGIEPMYRLSGPRGAFVIATAAHRIMTEAGWKRIDECFEKTATGCFVLRRGCTPIQVADLYHDRDMRAAEGVLFDGARGVGDDIGRSGIQAPEERVVLAQQDRRQKSDVRREDRSGARITWRSDGCMEWPWLHVRTSDDSDEGTRVVEMADRLGGASHRRRQDQQQDGQSSTGDEGGASVAAQAEAWSLVPVGERGVWDISVERDASYVAQGLIHHNSARGIQVHNLSRDTLDYELDAIDALLGGAPIDQFAVLGDDTPISRKLSLLIRPALVAPPGRVFVWSDWANIEARITPWLADDPDAEKRLDVFRQVDADPRIPDVYTRTAAELSNIPIEAVDKKVRQRGKVVDLACGFGGGKGALLSMAASFGMHLTEADAKDAVTRWREANPWAPRFWGRHDHRDSYGLWGAANSALEAPGEYFTAGRIGYVFLKEYLGGSLLCRLPSGRFLTYRRIKWERVEELDEDTNEIISVKNELMFSRDMGRIKLWPGLLAENVTQAAAADLLRGTLVALSEGWGVRLHTHDEVLLECEEKFAQVMANGLRECMEDGFEWTGGLPIKADATIARFYSKSPMSWGL